MPVHYRGVWRINSRSFSDLFGDKTGDYFDDLVKDRLEVDCCKKISDLSHDSVKVD